VKSRYEEGHFFAAGDRGGRGRGLTFILLVKERRKKGKTGKRHISTNSSNVANEKKERGGRELGHQEHNKKGRKKNHHNVCPTSPR